MKGWRSKMKRSGVSWCAAVLVATAPTVLDLTGGAVLAMGAASDARAEAADVARRAARRRWALMKMDEMANERLRCRERFTIRRQVEECEAGYTRRHREYNEIYIEAARE